MTRAIKSVTARRRRGDRGNEPAGHSRDADQREL
jgi:hypothetical protein